jgi:hypothetical protein
VRVFVWDVSLQVVRPSRPGLRTQAEYRVHAPDRDGAIGKARAIAARDGLDARDTVGVVKRWMVKGGLLG